MCNEIKCAIQSTVDLINININRDVQEECANRLMENDGCFLQFIELSPVDVMLCYETEFRSLMAWGKKLLLSLSVFAIMLLKRLPDGSEMKSDRLCHSVVKWVHLN